MIAAETLTSPDETTAGDFQYRSLSTGAIASMAFGALSLLVIFAGRDSIENALLLSPLPLVGIVMGLRAWGQIRANPDRYTGRKLALAGAAVSALCMATGLGLASYVYATEVPPGYARTSFEDFRPDEVEQRGDVLVPPDVAKLDGKKVFIKGYFRPGSSDFEHNASRFLLVRDNMTCCFGDLSSVKYFDQVAVQLASRKTVDYSPSLFRIGGVLRVFPENVRRGIGTPVYQLEADYAE